MSVVYLLSSAILYRSQSALCGSCSPHGSPTHIVFPPFPRLKDSKSTFKMASNAKKKKIETISLRTFKKWSFSEDFTVETGDDDQISLLKCKICMEHLLVFALFNC